MKPENNEPIGFWGGLFTGIFCGIIIAIALVALNIVLNLFDYLTCGCVTSILSCACYQAGITSCDETVKGIEDNLVNIMIFCASASTVIGMVCGLAGQAQYKRNKEAKKREENAKEYQSKYDEAVLQCEENKKEIDKITINSSYEADSLRENLRAASGDVSTALQSLMDAATVSDTQGRTIE